MPTTLNPTCPLCGLRYTDRPLLELHIREDHLQRDRHAEPDPGDSGDTATTPTPPRTRGMFPLHGPATGPFPDTREAAAAASARRPRRSRPGWARTALHRVVWALQYANQELMRALEALSLRRRVNGHGGDGVAGGGRA
jgi:hypothetical protein